MSQTGFNRPAEAFVVLCVAAASACAAMLAGSGGLMPRGDLVSALAFTALGLAWTAMTFMAARRGAGRVAFFLGPAAYQALAPLVAPPLVLAAAVLLSVADWAFHRRRFQVGLFNLSQIVISAWCAVQVAMPVRDSIGGPVGVAAAALAGGLAASGASLTATVIVIRLASGRSARESGALSFTSLTNELIVSCFTALLAVCWVLQPVLLALAAVPLTLMFTLLSRLEGRESALRAEIDERKRIQKDLRVAKEAAEAASQAKSEFLASMSHELRTPLNGIVGMTNLVLEAELPNEQRAHVDVVKRCAESLVGIIGDVLDFSRLEAGSLGLREEPFETRKWLDSATDLVAHAARERGLALHAELAADVPAWLRGDASRLRQIVLNLLSNALKFTEQGEVGVSIDVESREGARLVLHGEVRDTGIGIAPEKRDLIFEAFTQGEDYMTRAHGGTGLGLSITARLVKMMGGRIWVESEPGEGSRFHFTAELAVPTPEEIDQRRGVSSVAGFGLSLPPAEEQAVNVGSLRILLAEDNDVNQKLAVRLLQRKGHHVTVVRDGREALQYCRDEPVDVILMDIQMPEMDGLTATRAIRQMERITGRRVPIIALTAHAMEQHRAACFEAGMDGFVTKPIHPGKLYRALAEAVRLAEAETENEPQPV